MSEERRFEDPSDDNDSQPDLKLVPPAREQVTPAETAEYFKKIGGLAAHREGRAQVLGLVGADNVYND